MKIALLTPQYYPTVGGVPVLVDLLGDAFRQMGHEVGVLLGERRQAGPRLGVFDPLECPSAKRLIVELSAADAVVSLQECLTLTWPLALGLVRRPSIVFLQMHPQRAKGWRSLPKMMLKRRLLRSSRVCACSNYIAEDVRSDERIPVGVVHNPYDARLFKECPAVERSVDILYVGRLAIHKRCDILLQALAIRQQAGARHKVVIAGDGPEEGSLRALASSLRLGDCTFVGPVTSSDAALLMRQSKTLVVPSGYEPFGIVVLEGLASGCRVITSDAGGLKEAGGGFARTFRYNDADSLALAMRALDENPPTQEAAASCLASFLGEHSPRAVAEKLLEYVPAEDPSRS